MKLLLSHNNPEVQLLVKMLYDNLREMNMELKEITPQQFTRYSTSTYIIGDVAHLRETLYGK